MRSTNPTGNRNAAGRFCICGSAARAESLRRHSFRLPEGSIKRFDAAETRFHTDVATRKPGFQEQAFGAFDAAAGDLREDGATHSSQESPLESSAGRTRSLNHIADAHRLRGMVTDEAESFDQHWVVLGDNVGGPPGLDKDRLHLHHVPAPKLSRHQVIKEAGSFVTGIFQVESDAGEWRRGELTQEMIVIDADYGYVIRHV